jgi:hypothetical protein
MFENHAPLMRFITRMGIPLPRHLKMAAEFTLNAALRRNLEAEMLDAGRIKEILEEAAKIDAQLDVATLEFSVRRKLERLAAWVAEEPAEPERLQILDQAVTLVRTLPFDVNLWQAQNVFYGIRQSLYERRREESAQGNDSAESWLAEFRRLGEKLSVVVP